MTEQKTSEALTEGKWYDPPCEDEYTVLLNLIIELSERVGALDIAQDTRQIRELRKMDLLQR